MSHKFSAVFDKEGSNFWRQKFCLGLLGMGPSLTQPQRSDNVEVYWNVYLKPCQHSWNTGATKRLWASVEPSGGSTCTSVCIRGNKWRCKI